MYTTPMRARIRRCGAGAVLALAAAAAVACAPPVLDVRPAPQAAPTTIAQPPTTITIVPARTLVAVQITGSTTLAAGTNTDLTATGLFSDGSTEVLGPRGFPADGLVWSSSDTEVVEVDDSAGGRGAAFGVDGGTATVSASRDGIVATALVTVTGGFGGVLSVSPSPVTTVEGQPSGALTIEGSFFDEEGNPVSRPVDRWAGVETLDHTIATPFQSGGSWYAIGVRCGGTQFLVYYAGTTFLVPVSVGVAPLAAGDVAPAGC